MKEILRHLSLGVKGKTRKTIGKPYKHGGLMVI
jgi:hypothetical protein